ncbi:uncharacterized protein B0I36DRAFT_356143 [Microdochium trichocladiopsis]|uniref:Uncharacterized protein n=1 Tax=Microdochium trichocladiopsis TaxID=1682393 RepID=A0A9P8XQP3_9PEZI|nr:uncharacterized protein B0I36DRAFT_356143 [Microdochium trichocladiopsis]KAH7012041.1 hypothetical protein B0I36DRAFT_356143 [Microdochium trichocladiopsis]
MGALLQDALLMFFLGLLKLVTKNGTSADLLSTTTRQLSSQLLLNAGNASSQSVAARLIARCCNGTVRPVQAGITSKYEAIVASLPQQTGLQSPSYDQTHVTTSLSPEGWPRMERL